MDRRKRRTREAIRKAYFELMAANQGKTISVTELAERADIDRKTFYLHYETVDDILKEFFDERIELLRENLNSIKYFDEPLRVDLLIGSIEKLISDDINIYTQLAISENCLNFWNQVGEIMSKALINVYKDKVNVSLLELRIYAEFFSAGIIDMYLGWLRDPRGATLEDLGKAVVHVAQSGIMDIFKEN